METRARFALIGLFTICVIAGAFGFIFWFSGTRGGSNLKTYQIVFDTPVTGLSQGGAVLFDGIRVGEVAALNFDTRDPRLVVARVNISPDVPIKVTTKARLEFSGLTGVASIQLFDSDPRSADLKPKRDEDVPRLRAIPSPSLTTVLETMQSAGKHADDILVRVNRIVETNEEPINHTFANIEKLSAALDAGKINAAVENISNVVAKFDVDKLNHAIGSIDTVVSSLDVSTVNHTLKSIDSFATALSDSSDNVRAAAKDAAELTAKLDRAATTVDTLIAANSAPITSAMANLDKILAGVDVDKVRGTIDGFDKVATTLGNNADEIAGFIKDAHGLTASLNRSAVKVETFLASGAPEALTSTIINIDAVSRHFDGQKVGAAIDSIAKFANALGDNTPRVNQIARNADELFAKLDRSADTLDTVLTSARDLLRSPEGKGALVNIGDAARSIRKLADDLDHRSADLLANLTKFSGSGLRDIQLFAIDGRRALGDVGRTFQGVQRNPQQFIFGGKAALPVYGN